jgi:hypothetical protein
LLVAKEMNADFDDVAILKHDSAAADALRQAAIEVGEEKGSRSATAPATRCFLQKRTSHTHSCGSQHLRCSRSTSAVRQIFPVLSAKSCFSHRAQECARRSCARALVRLLVLTGL